MVPPTIAKALTISIVLATSALAAAYGLGAVWLPMAALFILGAVWILGQRAHWGWIGWLMVVLFAGAAAFGTLLELRPVLLAVGLIGAVSAWDLGEFAREVWRADAVEQEETLTRRHLRRLLTVDGLGLLLVLVTMAIEIRLSFGVALLLGLVALLGLSRTIGFLRRESD